MANFQRESLTFDQALNFTRGSEATYYDSDGVLQTAAIDEPRFDHDPLTGESLGLLIEERRTRLNTIAAAPTSPENVTVTATAHTISFFGTGTVDLTGVTTETLVGAGADDRVTLTFTPTAGTLTIAPSGTVENLQLEVGIFETSVILGEGSQVTRTADNCFRALGAEFNESGTGTLVMVFEYTFKAGFVNYLFSAIDTRRWAYTPGSMPQLRAYNGTEQKVYPDSPPPGAVERLAISIDGANTWAMARNGLSETHPTVAGASIFDVSDFELMGAATGKVGRVAYYPRALSAEELAILTAPEA